MLHNHYLLVELKSSYKPFISLSGVKRKFHRQKIARRRSHLTAKVLHLLINGIGLLGFRYLLSLEIYFKAGFFVFNA